MEDQVHQWILVFRVEIFQYLQVHMRRQDKHLWDQVSCSVHLLPAEGHHNKKFKIDSNEGKQLLSPLPFLEGLLNIKILLMLSKMSINLTDEHNFFTLDDKNNSRTGGPSPQGGRGGNCNVSGSILEQSVSQQQSVSSISGGFPPSSPGMVSSVAGSSNPTGNMNFPPQNVGNMNNNSNFMDIPSSPGPGKPDVCPIYPAIISFNSIQLKSVMFCFINIGSHRAIW